jgi:hypothetical protein
MLHRLGLPPVPMGRLLNGEAVPESMARGSSVISVDPTKTGSSYGFRSTEFPRLQSAIVSSRKSCGGPGGCGWGATRRGVVV